MARLTKKEKEALLQQGLKKCYACEQVLPIEHFSKDSSRTDGLNNRCKECDNIQVKNNTEENKEERLQYQCQYYQQHREKILQYHANRKNIK